MITLRTGAYPKPMGYCGCSSGSANMDHVPGRLSTPRSMSFYGFHWPDGASKLHDSGGDECGLDLDNAKSCSMENAGQVADFAKCGVAAELVTMLEPAAKYIVFYPAELLPNGILFQPWRDRVMRDDW